MDEIDINDFNVNNIQSASLLKDARHTFAVSKWISPKRTRSYPFERVYNLNELKTNFQQIAKIAANAYNTIEQTIGVKLHNTKGLENFVRKIEKESTEFIKFSRDKAKNAQNREFMTIQPKESLSTLTKAKITIKNYLGGEYFLTVDEILLENNIIYLIEKKHSKNLLSIGDIKDGLLKMILYSNLTEVSINGKEAVSKPVLHLTSTKLKGETASTEAKNDIDIFFKINNFSVLQTQIIKTIFEEAKQNNFIIKIGFSK
ncbi:MAG: hypothetical protein LBB59_06190 [Campylobacteraceae bacterium]|nr:hypothetical protein [Campylobacteraceae bacterium]